MRQFKAYVRKLIEKKTEVVKYVMLHELELMKKQLTEQADIADVLAIIRMIKARKTVKITIVLNQ